MSAPQGRILPAGSPTWKHVKDGDPVARSIFSRHYTYNRKREQISMFMPRNRNYSLIAGPGHKMLLITADSLALFVWRKFHSMDSQSGVNCAVFRNEGSAAGRSSDLILAAESEAWQRWPGERFYTYVHPGKVLSRNPGYCFICAGWKRCGVTSKGLLILEKLADELTTEQKSQAINLLIAEKANKHAV